jgi:hypothetical protein
MDDYDMLQFGFDTPIRSVHLHSGPNVPMHHDDATTPHVVPIDSIATADATYLPNGGTDLIILAIKPQELAPIKKRGHIDGGALASTIHLPSFLHDLRLYSAAHPSPIRLVTADNERFSPKGVGYLHVPSGEFYKDFHRILCFWCPEIPSCIISPHSFEALHDSGSCTGVTIAQNHVDGTCLLTSASSLGPTHDIVLEGIVVNKMCYSPELLVPPITVPIDLDTPPTEAPIRALNAAATRQLWHQRLGHIGDDKLYAAHHHIDGVPKFATKDGTLDKCPICLQAKLRKRARTHDSTRKATEPFQGIAMDFGFIVQKSNDPSRKARFAGLNGETCYILAVCHYCNELEGAPRVSKTPPVSWIRAYLHRNSNPALTDKYVMLDQGGELYNCQKIKDLFAEFDYKVFPTGAMSSWQNGVVEKPHQWIGDSIRAMLTGANLDPKFWPYCFRQSLRIKNAFPVSGYPNSATQRRTGQKANFANLRTIGCRVLVKPTTARTAKSTNHSVPGIYLGPLEYTLKNIQWYDPATQRVKIAYHCRFDEGFSDLALDQLPPNVQHLQRMQNGPVSEDLRDAVELSTPDFDISLRAFTDYTKDLLIKISCTHSTFGFIMEQDKWTDRPYISDFEQDSSATSIAPDRDLRRRYLGALIIAVDHTPVFTTDEAKIALKTFRLATPTATHLPLTIATTPLPTQQERTRLTLETNIELSHATTTDRAASTARSAMSNQRLVSDVESIPLPAATPSVPAITRATPAVPDLDVLPPATPPVPAIPRATSAVTDLEETPVPRAPRFTSSTILDVAEPTATLPRSSRPSGPSYVTDTEDDYPIRPVYWNKAVPTPSPFELSTDEPALSIADIRQIHFVRTGNFIAEDEVPSDVFATHMADSRRHFQAPPSCNPAPTSAILEDGSNAFRISAISSDKMTADEIALGPRLSRRSLKKISTWPKWQAAEFKQLDQFHALGMFGTPCRLPPGAMVMRMHWTYKRKEDGTYRSRACGDGSRRALPGLYELLDTYHSCLMSPIYRMHLALCALNGLVNYSADVVDAYAHADGPTVPCYLYVDEAYRDWWRNKTGETLAPGTVLPLAKALQGHPEAGKSYETKIVSILTDLGFKSTTHERNIYRGEVDGELVLLARQIDDFAIGTKRKATAETLCSMVGLKLKYPTEDKAPIKFLGLLDKFIGTDVHQTRHYTKLSCESYIQRMLQSHGWDKPSPNEDLPTSKPFEPLSHAKVEEIYQTVGPPEGSSQHKALEQVMKFPYRGLLGELLYAYVTARPDLGYSVTTLSKFATHPDTIHYQALKRLAIYLRQTITWGIIYWRNNPCMSLPDIPIHPVQWDTTEPFDVEIPVDQLYGYVDSAHATDLRNRRSTTGYAFCLAGGTIAWRAATQSVVATSSTEGEFIAAVSAAKTAKYLRSILCELGFAPTGPTVLFEDNASAIRMINNNRPTERSRHIDIAWFAIQDWRASGDVVLRHIKGTLNPSDDLTKALGWILHARHARRLLGHYGPPTASKPSFTA